MGQRDAKRAAAAGERTPTPIAEQWAYLRFLGFGAWWAWIWLCYNSTEIMRMFPAGVQTSSVLQMYLFSTAGIAGSMFVAACTWKTLTRLIDLRTFVVGVSALASLFTLLLGFSVIMGAGSFFISAALLTGVGTSVLCLKAGRIYGSISLGDSLTAGGISLLFAAFLYFVGVGIPPELRLFFIAALPLMSALLLTMGNPDPFPAADDNAGESVARGSFEWRAYRKLVAAAAIVAFTAGVGKGIASMIGNVDLFARSGTITVFCVGLIAVAIVAVVNRGDAVRGARSVYSGLIVLGIAMMLATCFGFDISFLSIGKECLWMVFSCFMAYLAFRYDFSAVRVFGIGQGAYFTASLVGWATGAALQPYYQDGVVRMGVGMVLAFLVVLVLVYVFPENDLKRIMTRSVDSEAEAARVRLAAAAAPACPAGACATCPANGVSASLGTFSPGEGAALAGQAADGEGDAGAAVPQASAAPQSPAAAPVAQQPPFAQPIANMFGAAGASDPAEPVPAAVPGNPADPVYGLSTRELEILDLFAQGRSANWIAEHLTISKNTVRTHLRAIYSKLDVHSRQELLDFLAGKRSEGE